MRKVFVCLSSLFFREQMLLLSKIERPVGFGGLCEKKHVGRDRDAPDVPEVGRDLGLGAVSAVIDRVEEGAAVTTTADVRRSRCLRPMRQRR